MPHIHTAPGQVDVTVSAWIFRQEGAELKVFVHMHRKIQKYMEVGGHMELDETPWQTIAHELEEESGYHISELEVYQPQYMPLPLQDCVVHPVPVLVQTFQPVRGHYHTDLCYAFYAAAAPKGLPNEHESQDTRWYTLAELEREAVDGDVLSDIVESYQSLAKIVVDPSFHRVAATSFSFDKPVVNEGALEKADQDGTLLELVRFGNPTLRKSTKQLTASQIRSKNIQQLIADIRYTNNVKQYGVGLAAPQVGKSVALSVIGIKPTPSRPHVKPFEQVIINPSYEGIGEFVPMWEGCQSCGSGDDTLYARVPRYRHVRAVWTDESGIEHNRVLRGFVAHVFQHETDHLNGILFVDRVIDSSSYMMADEYRKRVVNKKAA